MLLHQMFFGKVISGPITRFGQFFDGFESLPATARIADGMRRFMAGFANKVLIADTLAPTVNTVFGLDHGERSLTLAWFGLILFALQIFYDFSGYTDIAISLGQMFGLSLPENFDYPSIAKNIR